MSGARCKKADADGDGLPFCGRENERHYREERDLKLALVNTRCRKKQCGLQFPVNCQAELKVKPLERQFP